MIKYRWAPSQANDQNPMNSGALGRVEGWEDARPLHGSVRVNEHSVWSYITLKQIESWDSVRTHFR